MTDRIMYDGVAALAAGIARDFPAAAIVAGYCNGDFAWSDADWNLFPHAERVTISVTASANEGDVLDVESGDATPDETEGWIAMRKAAGLYQPTIYCSLSVVPAVRIGTGRWVLGRDYCLWVADYDGSAASVYPLSAAKQYRNTDQYDVSVVYDDGWPRRTPPGPPSVVAAPPLPRSPSAVWPAGVVLREGGSGAAVRVLQTALHDSGAYGARGLAPIDGIFGDDTLKAVRNFQQDRHLAVDGIAGPATRQALGV